MRMWLTIGALIMAGTVLAHAAPDDTDAATSGSQPNVVIIFADDLGYGDLSCYGNTEYQTPYLDRMASEGVRMTQFYVTSPACSPSRASLLTGQYPMRAGVPYVLGPKATKGIHPKSPLLSEILKDRGYATAAIGKWHLGHLPQFMPWNRGFDYFYGLPYSNDMKPTPLFRNKEMLEPTANQETLTARYTDEVKGFIDKALEDEKPFFVYYPNTFPHVPLFVSERFKGASGSRLYGDVVMELDWSVGQVLNHLKVRGIEKNTLVIFLSDNGPWMIKGDQGGSAGKLRGEKGLDYEGGVRVPFIAWWPGILPSGQVVDEPAITTDLVPTIARLTGSELSDGVVRDGRDIWPVISKGESVGERTFVYPDYYVRKQVGAVRVGDWKLLTGREVFRNRDARTTELINMRMDPYEKHNVADQHPQVVERLWKRGEKIRMELETSSPWGEEYDTRSEDALKYVTTPGAYVTD